MLCAAIANTATASDASRTPVLSNSLVPAPVSGVKYDIDVSIGARWRYDYRIRITGNESSFEGVGDVRVKAFDPVTKATAFATVYLSQRINDAAVGWRYEGFESEPLILREAYLQRTILDDQIALEFGARKRSFADVFFSDIDCFTFPHGLYAPRTYRYEIGFWARYRAPQDGWLFLDAGLVNGEGDYLEPTHDTNSSKSFECMTGIRSPNDRFRLLGYMKAGDGIGSAPAKRRDEIAGFVIGGSPHSYIDVELTGFLYVHGYMTDDLVELATKWGIEIPSSGEDIQFANYNPFLQEDIDPDDPGRKWTGAGGHIKVKLGASDQNITPQSWLDALSLTLIFSLYYPDKEKE